MKTLSLRLLPIALAALTMLAACTEKNDLETFPTQGFQHKNPNEITLGEPKIENWTQYTYEYNTDRYKDCIYLIAYGMAGSIGEVENWEFDWVGNHLKGIEYNGIWESKYYTFTYREDSTFSCCEYTDDGQKGEVKQFCWNGTNSGQLITKDYYSDENYVLYTINFDDNKQIASISTEWETYTFTWRDGNVTDITQDNGETWQYTYDNHQSTFAPVDGLLLVDIMEIPQLPRFLSKNNVTSIQSNQSHTNYGYTYDGGYTKKCSIGNTTEYFKYTNTPDPAPRLYRVSTNASGSGYYPLGALVKLDASFYSYDPSDIHFDRWDNGSTNPILIFTVTGDTSITAHYVRGYNR